MNRPTERDRDSTGRARNSRPRDDLGRPLPYGATGTPRLPEGVIRSVPETIELAQHLLEEGKPFFAHEVFEDAWKSSDGSDSQLWKGLAQLAVGITHAARGNRAGASALLRRGAATMAPFDGRNPFGVAVTEVRSWAAERAAELDREPGTAPITWTPPSLRGDRAGG
jgi:uncharacterized protein